MVKCNSFLHWISFELFIIITMMFREGQAHSPTKSECDSADAKRTERSLKGKGDGAGKRIVVWQSLRLDGRKVCNIERVGISQAESNKATVCALPSIHLPLTREASVVVRSKG